jgi:hypothetical protein
MTATASVRFGADGTAEVQSYIRLNAKRRLPDASSQKPR